MNEIIKGLIVIIIAPLANILITNLYNKLTGESKNFLWRDRYKDLNKIFNSLDVAEIKKRIRIVVIDDENSFPISLFQTEGYSIDKWDKVEDYKKLENGLYDIIVLDIKGVAIHISEEDGLGVLTDLKRKNPAQIIISYSQHSYDLSKLKFFQLADDNISKPSDYLKIKKIIDDLISYKFRPERYIKCISELLSVNNLKKREIKKIKNEISKSIKNKKVLSLYGYDFIDEKMEMANQLVSLTNTLSKFY